MNETTPMDQAQPQSIEDRIAAQFGLTDDQPEEVTEEAAPEESEETTEEPSPESDFAEIEYEGSRYQVPKALEKAIMQERDYTQKSQTLAEQKRQVEYTQKALEAARLEREFAESIKDEQQQLALMDNYLQQMKSVDVNQLSVDEGFKHWMRIQNLKEQRDAVDSSIKAKRDEYSTRAKQSVQALKAQARELLGKQGITEETLSELVKYGQTQGYSEQDIEMIQLDPRATSMLHKARLYDQLQANKAEAVQKAKTAPPAIKPGATKPMPDAVKQKLALRKAFKSAPDKASRDALMQKRVEALFG